MIRAAGREDEEERSCLVMDDDIIVIEEILTRLPVKDVLRCKLLSKSCYGLIGTSRFVKKHHLLQQQSVNTTSKIIVGNKNLLNSCMRNIDDSRFSWLVYTLPSSSSSSCKGGGEESQLSIPSSCNLFRIIVGSCNGLLVFSSDAKYDNLTLCNPATRKYISLPKHPLEDMLKSNSVKFYTSALGFAYDSKTGDYKLIKIGKYYNTNGTFSGFFQVWSMRTNSWKQINPAPMPRLFSEKIPPSRFCYGLLVNGILYWLVREPAASRHDPTILSFDPTNEKFGEIALPKEATRHCPIDVIDFMGSLALSFCRPSHSHDFHYFDIWVMGSGSVWTMKFSIGPLYVGVTPTRMCINGNLVLYGISLHYTESVEDCLIILYDPRRNEVAWEANVKGLEIYSRVAWSLTDSLVSVLQTTTCSNDDDEDEEEEEVNKLLRPPLLGVFLGCVGLSLLLLLRTR